MTPARHSFPPGCRVRVTAAWFSGARELVGRVVTVRWVGEDGSLSLHSREGAPIYVLTAEEAARCLEVAR